MQFGRDARMIHTAQFYMMLEPCEVSDLCKNMGDDIALLPNKLDSRFVGIKTAFRKHGHFWWMFVYVDFINLLGKPQISEKDMPAVRCKMVEYLTYLFGASHKELILTRLDYRLDVVIPESDHRKLLLKLYRKTAEKHGFKKKYDQYESTVYFNSKSCRVVCYDKMEERLAKGEIVQPHEKDVLRYEVCLLNRHLNYNLWKKYFNGNVCPIFYRGNYYKITEATKIIHKSSLSEKDKKKLREFLCDVSRNGISGVMKLKEKSNNRSKYSKYLVRKYIEMLEQLGINPILVPKNEKMVIKHRLSNPLL
jgi:hypothetical protein